jgi:hypothetical protein
VHHLRLPPCFGIDVPDRPDRPGNPGVAYQQIDRSELFLRTPDGAGRIVAIGDIAGNRQGRSSVGTYALNGVYQLALSTGRYRDFGAFRRKLLCDCPAETPPSAGYDRNPSL